LKCVTPNELHAVAKSAPLVKSSVTKPFHVSHARNEARHPDAPVRLFSFVVF
jgi:hypothetical protein